MKRVILPLVQATLFNTIVFLISISPARAQPVIGFATFVSGLSSTVDITHAGDASGRMFIVEQGGRIRIHNGTSLLPTAFLDISTIITAGGESGLLSLAFHPNYEVNRYFFVYYTNLSGDITIARYQAQAGNPNLADAASGVVLITVPKPFSNHNGGDLNFGPDGYLYFGTGDGGSGGDPNNYAQTGTSLLGKMIRIDIDGTAVPPYYTIPPDNPYISDPLVDDRIWALGLRNPWRWSFDRATNDMWIADVGQGAWEEVNFRAAGTTGGINYGWRCYEGTAPYNTTGCLPAPNYISPIFQYPHDFATGGFSITGGFVYRGTEFPVLQGYYICADYVSGNAWLIRPDGLGGWITRRQAGASNISGFGEAENGTLYAVSLGGTIYRVTVTSVLPVSLVSFYGTKQTGYNEIRWNTADEQNINRYVIEYSVDGSNWVTAGEQVAVNQPGGHSYSFNHYTSQTVKLFYRLRIEETASGLSFSQVISINGKAGAIRVFPTIVKNNSIQVSADRPVTRIDIMDNNGALVFSKHTGGQQGYFTINLPVLSHGLYWAKLQTDSGYEVVKLLIE